MDDVDKLNHLLAHWIEHNASHEEGYERWARVAEEAGFTEAARAILEARDLSQEMSRRLEEARRRLGGGEHV